MYICTHTRTHTHAHTHTHIVILTLNSHLLQLTIVNTLHDKQNIKYAERGLMYIKSVSLYAYRN